MAKHDLKLNVQKVNGKVRYAKVRMQKAIKESPDGDFELIWRQVKNPKTSKQRGNIFGNMIRTVVEYCNDNDHIIDTSDFLDLLFDQRDMPSGIEVTSDFVKHCLYSACPIFDENGDTIGLSDSDTIQANKFFEESAALLSIRVTPIADPNKDWRNEVS